MAQEAEQDGTYRDLGEKLIQYGHDLNKTADDFESNRNAIDLELKRLKDLVDKKNISLEQAAEDAQALEKKIQLGLQKQDDLNNKYREIDTNFRKYVFLTRMQKIVPFIYAAAAVSASNGNVQQKALYGLAGYGTGALIENTGYGISRAITWLRFERSF